MLAYMTERLREAGAEVNKENLDLLLSKGVFPYTWFDHHNKLTQTALPARSEWYDTLSESDVSDETFEKAQKVWNLLNMKTFKEYHDLYLFGDVMSLADVISSFRDTFMKTHKLDPVYYVSTSSYSWDAMLFGNKCGAGVIN